jgi:hypothetical protein
VLPRLKTGVPLHDQQDAKLIDLIKAKNEAQGTANRVSNMSFLLGQNKNRHHNSIEAASPAPLNLHPMSAVSIDTFEGVCLLQAKSRDRHPPY